MFLRNAAAAAVAAAFAWAAVPGVHAAPAPKTIGFMGVARSAVGTPLSGPVNVHLALYGAATGGTAVWSEDQTVTATNGLFSTALGVSTPITGLDFSSAYFVGITVQGDAAGEMTPRIPLQGVPYAMLAQTVAGDSVGSAQLAVDNASLTKMTSGQISGAGTGTVTVQGATGGTVMQVVNHASVGTGLVVTTPTTNGQVPLASFSHSNLSQGVSIGYNAIYQSGSNGAADLDVFAKGSGVLGLERSGAGPVQIGSDSGVRVQSDGSVGIGTATPGAKLDVVGDARVSNGLTLTGGALRFPDATVQATAAFGPAYINCFSASGTTVPTTATPLALQAVSANSGFVKTANSVSPTASGTYYVHAAVQLAQNASDTATLIAYVNGVEVQGSEALTTVSSNATTRLTTDFVVAMSAGQSLTVAAIANGPGVFLDAVPGAGATKPTVTLSVFRVG